MASVEGIAHCLELVCGTDLATLSDIYTDVSSSRYSGKFSDPSTMTIIRKELDAVNVSMTKVSAVIAKARASSTVAVREPELWKEPFPVTYVCQVLDVNELIMSYLVTAHRALASAIEMEMLALWDAQHAGTASGGGVAMEGGAAGNGTPNNNKRVCSFILEPLKVPMQILTRHITRTAREISTAATEGLSESHRRALRRRPRLMDSTSTINAAFAEMEREFASQSQSQPQSPPSMKRRATVNSRSSSGSSSMMGHTRRLSAAGALSGVGSDPVIVYFVNVFNDLCAAFPDIYAAAMRSSEDVPIDGGAMMSNFEVETANALVFSLLRIGGTELQRLREAVSELVERHLILEGYRRHTSTGLKHRRPGFSSGTKGTSSVGAHDVSPLLHQTRDNHKKL